MSEEDKKPIKGAADEDSVTKPQKLDGDKTVDNGKITSADDKNTSAQVESPYKAELERLKAKYDKDLAHKERAIQDKDEANQRLLAEIQDLKTRITLDDDEDEKVEIEGTSFAKKQIIDLSKALKIIGLSPDELKGLRGAVDEIRNHIVSTKEDTEIARLTTDPEEAELIRLHLEKTVKRTGNPIEDVRNAYAIANKHLTEKKLDRENEDDVRVAAAGASIISGRSSSPPGMTAGKREALKILKSVDPSKKWEKYL